MIAILKHNRPNNQRIKLENRDAIALGEYNNHVKERRKNNQKIWQNKQLILYLLQTAEDNGILTIMDQAKYTPRQMLLNEIACALTDHMAEEWLEEHELEIKDGKIVRSIIT